MQTITVELLNDNALMLLQQLERLHVLRLVASQKQSNQPKRQWAGSLSQETANKMLEYVNQSRDEWNRDI